MPPAGLTDTPDIRPNVLESGCELSSSSAANSTPYVAIPDRDPDPPGEEVTLPAYKSSYDWQDIHIERTGGSMDTSENPGTSQVQGLVPTTKLSTPAENDSQAAPNSQPSFSGTETTRGACSPKSIPVPPICQSPLASRTDEKCLLPGLEVNTTPRVLGATTSPIVPCVSLGIEPSKPSQASMDDNTHYLREESRNAAASPSPAFMDYKAGGDEERATVAWSELGAAGTSTSQALAACINIGETIEKENDINILSSLPNFGGYVQASVDCATDQPNIPQDTAVPSTSGYPASQQLEITHPPCRSLDDVQRVEEHLADAHATTTQDAEMAASSPNLATAALQQVEQGSGTVGSSIAEGDVETPQCKSLQMLLDLLAHVKRMDPEGFFKEPVDEELAEAPGYYDSIANPMDFSTIQSELMCSHNISWTNFTEAFELVCLNALLYNRKGSRIHKSAQQLLRNGRRFLQGKELEGRRAMTTCTCYAPGTEASQAVSILTKLGPGSSYLKHEEKAVALENHVRRDDEIGPNPSTWPSRISQPDDEDGEVEHDSDAASESSSSFGSAGSEPGEGVPDPFQAPCESLPTSRDFQRLPIGAEWKRYRRGVEWRCRWLELREQDLERQLRVYTLLETKLLAKQASKLAYTDVKLSMDASEESSLESRAVSVATRVDTPTPPRTKDINQPDDVASSSRAEAEEVIGGHKFRNDALPRGHQNQESTTAGTSARLSLAFTGQGQTSKVHHRRHRKRTRCQSIHKSRKSKKQEVMWARSGKPVNQDVMLDSGHLLELSCHPVLSRLYTSRANPSTRRKRVEAEAKDAPSIDEQEVAAAEKLTLMQQVALAVVAVDDLSSSDSEVSTMALFEQMQDLQRKVGLLKEKLGAHMGERLLPSRTPSSTIARAGSGFGQSRQRKISMVSMPSSPCRSSAAGAVSGKKDASNRHQQAAAAYLKRKVTPQEEFDLNNIVGGNMGGAGPRFIERAPHMLINTPKVRDLEASDATRAVPRSMQGGAMSSERDGENVASSDEDTSDEAYLARHAPLELMERSRNTYAVSGRGKRGQKKKKDYSYTLASNGGKYGVGKTGRKGACVGRPPLNGGGESSGKMGRYTSHSSHDSISLLSRENSGIGVEDISIAPVIKMEDAELLIEQSMAEAEAVERRAASDAAARAQVEAVEASRYDAGKLGGVGADGLAHLEKDPHVGMVQLPGMLPMQIPGLGVDAMTRGMPGGDTIMPQYMSASGAHLQETSSGPGVEGMHHQQHFQASSSNGDHRDLIAAADSLLSDMDELMEEAMHDERAASQSAAADRLDSCHPSTSTDDASLPIPQALSAFQIPYVPTTDAHDAAERPEMILGQSLATGTHLNAENNNNNMHDASWKVSASNPAAGSSGVLKIVLKRAPKTG